MEYYSLEGRWQVDLPDGFCGEMTLPGTLDENQIGYRDTGSNQWHPEENFGEEAGVFDPDAPIATRFTRKYTFEGEARLSRKLSFTEKPGKRLFLEAERARVLRLLIDGQEVPHAIPPSISTPQVFEVTGRICGNATSHCSEAERSAHADSLRGGRICGEHEITLLSDNSYPGLPRDAIVYSSAATDETQTNWNGVLGYLRLREENEVFLRAVRVYPELEWAASLEVEIDAARAFEGTLLLSSEAFISEIMVPVSVRAGCTKLVIKVVQAEERIRIAVGAEYSYAVLASELRLWDEEEGNLYELTVRLLEGDATSHGSAAERAAIEEKTIRFGFRVFGDNGKGRLALNGRTIFLRGEANCAEFPEEGHPPMDKAAWLDILRRYQSYGVNCMRFHSHCPPEAAFEAADELGMLMQPELSHWNPKTAFEDEESFSYYQKELTQILKTLANHPSFVMLTLGNELWAHEKGRERMRQMLKLAHAADRTRLYASASNGFYGTEGCDEASDFYTSQYFYGLPLRGTYAAVKKGEGIQGYINNRYPDTCMNYDSSMEELRKTCAKPVFGFEVGQFEVLPDFGELDDFHGISDPANLKLIREKAEECGLLEDWSRYVEATGELALIGYREEIEAAMRTRELSGLSLLGLQDFPGQGTALVGMMNSHLQPKPYAFARPERFRAFFRSQMVLAEFPRYTYESNESLRVKVKVANFGKQEICAPVRYELRPAAPENMPYGAAGSVSENMSYSAAGAISEKAAPAAFTEMAQPIENAAQWVTSGELPQAFCPAGEVTEAGEFEISLAFADRPMRLNLFVQVGIAETTYPIWVYPPTEPVCPEMVYETEVFDAKTREVLENGGIVYLTPPAAAETLPSSIRTQFTTDFWSVGTFPAQEGGMGQLIDDRHPLFADFPTEFHTNWQWWPMATQRAILLPEYKKSIVAQMDSYASMRPMTQLLECRCGKGRLLLSAMGLQNLQQYPEARALQNAIYSYLASEQFRPEQEIEPEVLAKLVR